MKTREIVLGAAAILCIGALSSAQIAPQGQRSPAATIAAATARPDSGPCDDSCRLPLSRGLDCRTEAERG